MDRTVFLDRIQNGILLFDGAIGTQLQARGLKMGEVPEQWNLVNPDAVRGVHSDYVKAGADVITTNSFGGSRYKLEKSGLSSDFRTINIRAARLAKEAAGESVLVAGSVGPTGEFLEPLGMVKPEAMRDVFQEQIEALVEGGADLIIIETMMALDEAGLAVEAARSAGVFPVIASMTFELGKQGYRTMMGIDIPTAVNGLIEKGADVVGSNCGNGIDGFVDLVKTMRGVTNIPLIAEANAGLPQLIEGRTVYNETPEIMARKLPALIKAGANIVGGCCGTTPEHIQRFREIVQRL